MRGTPLSQSARPSRWYIYGVPPTQVDVGSLENRRPWPKYPKPRNDFVTDFAIEFQKMDGEEDELSLTCTHHSYDFKYNVKMPEVFGRDSRRGTKHSDNGVTVTVSERSIKQGVHRALNSSIAGMTTI